MSGETWSVELMKLRDEVIGFERDIAELNKWKMVAIAAVFAVGLGLSGTEHGSPATNLSGNALLALLAIPVLTACADLISKDYDLRLSIIASFIGRAGPDASYLAMYERDAHPKKKRPRQLKWLLGHAASIGSSLLANMAVIAIGFSSTGLPICYNNHPRLLLILAGVAGVVLTILIALLYSQVNASIWEEFRHSTLTRDGRSHSR